MRKYWHKIDELFHNAHEEYQDEASSGSWEKITRALDRYDAHQFKKKFVAWKRTSICLVLLLSGLAIYEFANIRPRKNKLPIAANDRNSAKKLDSMNAESALSKVNESKSPTAHQKYLRLQEQSKDGVDHAKNAAISQVSTTITKQIATKSLAERRSRDQNAIPGESLVSQTITGKQIGLTPHFNLTIAKTDPTAKTVSCDRDSKLIAEKNLSQKLIDSRSPELFSPRWTISAVVANDWAGYRLDNDAPDNLSGQNGNVEDERDKINSRERNEFSYSVAVLASRQLSTKWGLKSGLIFSQTSIGIDPQEIHAYQTPDGSVAYKYIISSGYVYVKPGFANSIALGDSIQSTEAQHDLSTFALPIMASRYFTSGKFSVIPSAGITFNYISKARLETELQTMQNREYVFVSRLEGMRKYYFGLIGDIDVRYMANKHWSIGMLSSFRYALTPITKNNVVKTFPYSFSVGGTVSYAF